LSGSLLILPEKIKRIFIRGEENTRMVDIPKTSKAAVLEEYGKPLQIREVPIPDMEPRSILVKAPLRQCQALRPAG
jgi:hypothetical protein